MCGYFLGFVLKFIAVTWHTIWHIQACVYWPNPLGRNFVCIFFECACANNEIPNKIAHRDPINNKLELLPSYVYLCLTSSFNTLG